MASFFRSNADAFAASKARALDYQNQQRANAGSFMGDLFTNLGKFGSALISPEVGSPADTAQLIDKGREIASTITPPDVQVPDYREPLPELPTPPDITPPPIQADTSHNGFTDTGSSNPFMEQLMRALRGTRIGY